MEAIWQKIKETGGRMTTARKEIVRVLYDADCLMTGAEIAAVLKKQQIRPVRSTIFRELVYLTKNNIAIKVTIAGTDYYEIPCDHHHHLVCVGCNAISKVVIGSHLEKEEKRISRSNGFEVMYHSLEFYGWCRTCKTSQTRSAS
jgi:Fur family ferric uptake transcriptional regulator